MISGRIFSAPAFRVSLLMAASFPVWPASITNTFVSASAPPGGSIHVDSGQLRGATSAIAGPVIGDGGNGILNAFAQGSADYGILKAFASAYSPAFDVYQPQAYTSAMWRDTIHVISPGNALANGTPVTLLFSMHLGDTLTSTENDDGSSTVNARSSLDGIGAANFLFIHDHFLRRAASHEVSGQYVTQIGASLTIGATLVAAVGPQNRNEIANAFSTGLFAMEFLTAGAGYTSDSGTIFATSFASETPEPGSWVLVGTGLALAVRRRRRRTSPLA